MASVSLLVWTWPGGTLIAVPASSLMALFPAVECHHLIAKENKDMLTKYRGWFLCIAFEIWFPYIAKSER